jgi:hypothetical protein
MMTYRVFDTSINKLFGVFPTEAEAMHLVRVLLSDDAGYADDLAVSCEADDGSFASPLFGAALIARVDEVAVEQARAKAQHHKAPSHI